LVIRPDLSVSFELKGRHNLTSIKGIGNLEASILLSVIGNISDFADEGKLAAYFGIVPRVQNLELARIHRHYPSYMRRHRFVESWVLPVISTAISSSARSFFVNRGRSSSFHSLK
jgi:hypothetical protein